MSSIESILTSAEFWKISAPAAFGTIAWLVNERAKRQWERWQLKKVACLKALNIANAILSNYKYPNVKNGDMVPQYETIESVRSCFNDLACTCDGPEVIAGLKKIMFERVTPAEIVDLRAAVRKELGMGSRTIDTDREKSFIGKVNCETPRDA